jgi:hypothetical protein
MATLAHNWMSSVVNNLETQSWISYINVYISGADLGFQVRGAHLKKLHRAEGGAKIFGVFRVKNHDFTPKKLYFFQLRREARKCLGYFVWKITILRQKFIFFPILGGRPPLDPPLHMARFINFMNSLVPNGIVHLLFLFSHFNSPC